MRQQVLAVDWWWFAEVCGFLLVCPAYRNVVSGFWNGDKVGVGLFISPFFWRAGAESVRKNSGAWKRGKRVRGGRGSEDFRAS